VRDLQQARSLQGLGSYVGTVSEIVRQIIGNTVLTIKLDDIVPYGFLERPPACDMLQQALLLRLLLVELQNPKERRSDEREDDGKGSITPSPIGIVKPLGSFRSGESGYDVGRGGVGVGESSVS
jgi:hypothetical protein